HGSDTNSGAANSPLASLPMALTKCRDLSQRSGKTPQILLRDGVYPLAQPVMITSASAADAVPVQIQAAPNEHPTLSGALAITNWQKLERPVPGLPDVANGRTWVADVPKINGQTLVFRQLWVDGSKAIRARQPNGESLARLAGWNKTNQVATISRADLGGLAASTLPTGVEMIVDQVWEIAVLRVNSLTAAGNNALLTFKQPESRLEFQHPWPPVTVNAKYQAPFFLANAIEFLDQPGEWFEDVPAGKIYYWPRAGENMAQANVFAPVLETLVQIEGSPTRPVSQVQFKGITFAYTTWLRPSQQGHVPLQAGMYLLDARKLSPKGMTYHPGLDNLAWIGRPPAAVTVKYASQISFEDCAFEHLAAAGLDFVSSTHGDSVLGCIFRDVGGNGLQLGAFSDTKTEAHVPYLPADEMEVTRDEKIADNVFTDCGNEDWGSVGIAVGYARNITVAHNEVFNLPYTGISVGWGWTKQTNALRDNLVFANRVHHIGQRLGDLGGIYLLSAQPGTVVAGNCISDIVPSDYVPDPNHWFYLYLDEGSSGITVRDNWCPTEKFLRNANGPGNVWTNNGPLVSEEIQKRAGLEPAYTHLLTP
ncbi:MAG TPA: right-handed parallel beta-helix repeat-containing protein, partial [Verrucomicrobiae bacterium]